MSEFGLDMKQLELLSPLPSGSLGQPSQDILILFEFLLLRD